MVTPTDIKYAQRLRGLRMTKGLKQIEAAELLAFNNQQSYSKLENGQSPFTDEIIEKICTSFEIEPQDFTNTDAGVNIDNSPNANSPNSSFLNNDISLVNELIKTSSELLKAKNEVIRAKDEIILGLKKEIEQLNK